jgi:hypothetical protein
MQTHNHKQGAQGTTFNESFIEVLPGRRIPVAVFLILFAGILAFAWLWQAGYFKQPVNYVTVLTGAPDEVDAEQVLPFVINDTTPYTGIDMNYRAVKKVNVDVVRQVKIQGRCKVEEWLLPIAGRLNALSQFQKDVIAAMAPIDPDRYDKENYLNIIHEEWENLIYHPEAEQRILILSASLLTTVRKRFPRSVDQLAEYNGFICYTLRSGFSFEIPGEQVVKVVVVYPSSQWGHIQPDAAFISLCLEAMK